MQERFERITKSITQRGMGVCRGVHKVVCRRHLRSGLQSVSQGELQILHMYCSEAEGQDDLMRMARALGFLSRRPWYSSMLLLSRYTLLISWLSGPYSSSVCKQILYHFKRLSKCMLLISWLSGPFTSSVCKQIQPVLLQIIV